MQSARDVIAGYEFERACGGGDEDYNATFSLCDEDADAIIAALDAAGFVIVPKDRS